MKIEPTQLFRPFGEGGPRIVLFGKETGNWSMNRLQEKGDHISEPGLYSQLSRLGQQYYFQDLLAPSPVHFNTTICGSSDLSTVIQNGAGSVRIFRGCQADGVVLRYGQVGAIPTADCPSIVVYCQTSRLAIIAHAGAGSLVDIDHILHGKPARQHPSVVDAIVEKAKETGFVSMQVFVTCGIARYQHSELANFLRWTKEGRRSVLKVENEWFIEMKTLIADQFAFRHEVTEVWVDTIDTFHEVKEDKEYRWYSYQREKQRSEKEKAKRNLVLVLNN